MATHDVHGGFAKSPDRKRKRKTKVTPAPWRRSKHGLRQEIDPAEAVTAGEIRPDSGVALGQAAASSEADLDDEGDVIAGVVPVPPGIAPSVRHALATALVEKFSYPEDLDQWLHAPHRRLAAATPFECLVKGAALAVYQALVTESAECIGGSSGHR